MAAWPRAHCKTLKGWQTTEGKKAARDNNPFFFLQGKLLEQLNLSGCCCQNGGNLSSLLSTPAASPPLLPSHLLSLADTQWCSSDWNFHGPSSLSLPGQWTECGCRQGLKSARAAGHNRSNRRVNQKQGEGDNRDSLLSATEIYQIQSSHLMQF